MPAKIATIATTIINSIKVKPREIRQGRARLSLTVFPRCVAGLCITRVSYMRLDVTTALPLIYCNMLFYCILQFLGDTLRFSGRKPKPQIFTNLADLQRSRVSSATLPTPIDKGP